MSPDLGPGDPRPGDTATGDLQSGDGLSGDLFNGDMTAGDTSFGDASSGDKSVGDFVPPGDSSGPTCRGFSGAFEDGVTTAGGSLTLTGSDVISLDNFPRQLGDLAEYWALDGNGAITNGSTLTGMMGTAAQTIDPDATMGYVPAAVLGGVSFDGVNDLIDAGNPAPLQFTSSMTINAWVRSDVNQNATVFAKSDTASLGWGLYLVAGTNGSAVEFRVKGAPPAPFVASTAGVLELENGSWYHLAGAYSSTAQTLQLYINGENIGAPSAAPLAQVNSTANVRLGGGDGGPLDGAIDEAALFDDTIPAQFIRNLFIAQAAERTGLFLAGPCSVSVATTWSVLAPVPERPLNKGTPLLSESAYTLGNFNPLNLVALWPLDGSGVVTTLIQDATSNGHHGTGFDTNSTLAYRPARLGGGLTFDGAGDFVQVQNPATFEFPTQLTLSAWVRTHQRGGGDRTIIGKWGTGAARAYRMYVRDDGVIGFEVHTGGSLITVWGPFIADWRWHHAVATFTVGGFLDLYVNGVPEASSALINPPRDRSGAPLFFGGDSSGAYFPGTLDEVSVFDRALTPPQVSALWLRGSVRVAYQVRSCDDVACAGDPFVGPAADPLTGFSGEDDHGPGIVSHDLTFLTPQRHFQWSAILATDDLGVLPVIEEVEVFSLP